MPRPFKTSNLAFIIVLVALTLISVAFLRQQQPDNSATSISSFIFPPKISPDHLPPIYPDPAGAVHPIHPADPPIPSESSVTPPPRRHNENATFFMLATNSESDIKGAVQSVRELEDRFNHRYHYPWIFLNDKPFSDEFKTRVSVLASGPVYFGQIPEDHWNSPPWIDDTKMKEQMKKMDDIPRAGSISYHNMCRFNSGFYFRHPLLQSYRYSWRVEPAVHFPCNINFDPFTYLRENNKTYGFTLTMNDYGPTMPSLWPAVKDFIVRHPQYVSRNSAINFLLDDDSTEYNNCIFYNNFEIADMAFWRGEAYTALFDHLDRHGGFYYERWGDAPVHTIAAALLSGTDRIHFFREIGYEHEGYTHCPLDDLWRRGRCTCDPAQNFDFVGLSCLPRWERISGRQ